VTVTIRQVSGAHTRGGTRASTICATPSRFARWSSPGTIALRSPGILWRSAFFVVDPNNGKRSNVGVVREASRAPFLRTYADGDWNNNLLSLDQCPISLKAS